MEFDRRNHCYVVIESRSSSDTSSDTLNSLQEKMQEYIEQGVQLGLLTDDLRSVGDHRKNYNVYVYRPNLVFELLKNPEVVNCEPELSGFELKMAKIWYKINYLKLFDFLNYQFIVTI